MSIDDASINKKLLLKTKDIKPTDYYINGISEGNRFILAEAITLIESNTLESKKVGTEIALYCHNKVKNQNTVRVSITGPPGAGKSTFINEFGIYLIHKGHKVAVLAIDPSSTISGGSVLGDKSRMEDLSIHQNAYVRPSAAGSLLGGIAYGTKDSIPLCEAAGYDFIIIETVGVGQSEYLASSITDMTLLLVQPGSGDDLQGMKKGIVEMADIMVVTKADGNLKELALQSKKYIKEGTHYSSSRSDGFTPPILITSAIEKLGFDSIYNSIFNYYRHLENTKGVDHFRYDQDCLWFQYILKENAYQWLMTNDKINKKILELQNQIKNGDLSGLNAREYLHEFVIKLIANA